MADIQHYERIIRNEKKVEISLLRFFLLLFTPSSPASGWSLP